MGGVWDTMSMITVRPIKKTDQTHVLRLLADLQDHVAHLDPFHRLRNKEEFNVQQYFKQLRKQLGLSGRIFLALYEGQVVGLVAAAITSSAKSNVEVKPGLERSGRVFELIVVQAARGLGVGKKLLQVAEQFLRSKKCSIIFIGCFATNTAALEFYRRNGYVERNIEFAKKVSIRKKYENKKI